MEVIYILYKIEIIYDSDKYSGKYDIKTIIKIFINELDALNMLKYNTVFSNNADNNNINYFLKKYIIGKKSEKITYSYLGERFEYNEY